jgi:hypothetical protein
MCGFPKPELSIRLVIAGDELKRSLNCSDRRRIASFICDKLRFRNIYRTNIVLG